jgi:hypothetical protein
MDQHGDRERALALRQRQLAELVPPFAVWMPARVYVNATCRKNCMAGDGRSRELKFS